MHPFGLPTHVRIMLNFVQSVTRLRVQIESNSKLFVTYARLPLPPFLAFSLAFQHGVCHVSLAM